jgi:hypothetical protein
VRSRLRPAYSPEELARLYAVPHRHDLWPDHVLRVNATTALGRELLGMLSTPPAAIADLSCGDGTIARSLFQAVIDSGAEEGTLFLGDLAPGYVICGPIEETIRELPHADVFICTETLEHLDDPDAVLAMIRARAGALILSTPDSEPPGINAEHYWTWGTEDVRAMLVTAGWEPVLNRNVTWLDESNWRWAYQIWGCT